MKNSTTSSTLKVGLTVNNPTPEPLQKITATIIPTLILISVISIILLLLFFIFKKRKKTTAK